jgi:hypothetical protein
MLVYAIYFECGYSLRTKERTLEAMGGFSKFTDFDEGINLNMK